VKPSQQSLKDWTEQKWRTKSGKPSTQGPEATGERYLPAKAIEAMSSSEYAATTAKKREDTKEGKQFSKQPKKAATTARQYRNEGGLMSMFGPIEKPEEGLAALFQNRMQKAEGGAMHRMPDGSMMAGASHRSNYFEGGTISKKDIDHINSLKNKKDRESLIGKYQIFAGYDAIKEAGIDELKEPEKAKKIQKEAAEKVLKELERLGLNKGGKAMYAEGGSLFIPPEMEAVPEDTYDNIPPEEMEEAMASQLPDGEMVEEYKTYVMTQALEGEEASYLQNALEADPQLRQIFDKVLVTASEFSGAGEVEGPGTGVSDSIPARLSDGEFVMTRKATDQIGAENLQTMMDEAERAYDGGLMSRRTVSNTDLEPSEEEDVKKMMREANRMPSIR